MSSSKVKKNIVKVKNQSTDDIRRKVKDFATEKIAYSGYLLYIWNSEKLAMELKPMVSIEPTIQIRSTKEIFQVGIPAGILNGKPLFVAVRGIPYTVEMDLTQTKIKDGFKTLLTLKGYSASEIEAKLNSIYINRIFRAKVLSRNMLILWILSLITSVLITSMGFMVYIMAID